MNSDLKCYGIIPARYGASRFPGKPLADICGKPMFWHVYQRASQCRSLARVILATDDRRIFDAAEKLEVPVLMTSADHPSGSDRVLEAAIRINVPEDGIVINIQGDEPLLDPEMLTVLVELFQHKEAEVTTLARPISSQDAQNPDIVKVVMTNTGRALYFSRSPIPFCQDSPIGGYFGHVGLYGYRLQALKKFVAFEPSPLERSERLEQLRLLENNMSIQVGITHHETIGVDRPADIDHVVAKIAESGR